MARCSGSVVRSRSFAVGFMQSYTACSNWFMSAPTCFAAATTEYSRVAGGVLACARSAKLYRRSGDSLIVRTGGEELVIQCDRPPHRLDPRPIFFRCPVFFRCELFMFRELACGFHEGAPVFCRRRVVQLEELQAQVVSMRFAFDRFPQHIGRVPTAFDERRG